jgi:DNA mismatch repair protein MutS
MDRLADEYRKLRENCGADVLLYQVGTFYRIMFEDARKVAGPLGLKLFVTGEASSPMPVCGFPKSGLDKYIGKLVRAGFSAAVCHQVKLENGAIRREISEVVMCSKI